MKYRYESAWAWLVSIGTTMLMAIASPMGCGGTAAEPTGSTAQEVTGSISITGTFFDAIGNPLPGVTVRLAGHGQSTVTTGSNGAYAFAGLDAASYSLHPSLSGCTFVPNVVTLNNLAASAVVNFDGAGPNCGGESSNSGATNGPLSLSGIVTNAAGSPVRGVRILLNGKTQAVRTTTAGGTYSFQVTPGSYSLNPTGPCTFTPGVVNLNSIAANQTQNFVAGAGCGSMADAGAPDASDDGARDSAADARDAEPERVCVPTTCAAAGRVCGPLADGCDGTLQCGTCPTGQDCNATGQCIAPQDPCDVSTIACIQAQDSFDGPRCSQCVSDNGCFDPAQQGGTCEGVAGTAPASCATALGVTATPSETQVCLFTLKNIFSSHCAATLQETPCLCGETDAAQCLAETAAPTGPLLPVYTCDLGATVSTIVNNFTLPTFGAGQANAIVQCAAAYGCNCF